jgi:hypothetical protein
MEEVPVVRTNPYLVSLIGVEAPDGIGTYSIRFTSADVIPPSSPLSGSDLTPGKRKDYRIVVTDDTTKPKERGASASLSDYPNLPPDLEGELGW